MKKYNILKPLALCVIFLQMSFISYSGTGAYPSNVKIRDTSSVVCKNLDVLCRVWGFVKYYHPAMAAENYDMDAELFSIIHKVAYAGSADERNIMLLKWASRFGRFKSGNNVRHAGAGFCVSANNSWIRDRNMLGKDLSGLLVKMENASREYLSGFAREGIPGSLSFQGEKTYVRIPSEDAGFRLLSLFRLWNAVKYFSPDSDAGGKMDSLLVHFIPKFIKCSSDGELKLLLNELESSLPALRFSSGPDTISYAGIKPLNPIARSGYSLLDKNIGYLYPGTLTYEKLNNAMYELSGASGIIIDLRSAPKEFLCKELASYFVPGRVCFALSEVPCFDFPGEFICKKIFCSGGSAGKIYKGRIVLLVNGKTSSGAEYIAMCLQQAPNVITIGEHTPGTAGNTIYLPLPYAGTGFYFQCSGIKYPDGTSVRGRGVKIDKMVRSSPGDNGGNCEGGGDELIEEAERIIMD